MGILLYSNLRNEKRTLTHNLDFEGASNTVALSVPGNTCIGRLVTQSFNIFYY